MMLLLIGEDSSADSVHDSPFESSVELMEFLLKTSALLLEFPVNFFVIFNFDIIRCFDGLNISIKNINIMNKVGLLI